MTPELSQTLDTLVNHITTILSETPSIYLYGSVVLSDFRQGWSDIDLLVLTQKPISDTAAEALIPLRQTMQTEDPSDPYIRACEGAMLSLDAFLHGTGDNVVYWGTSGQRRRDHYALDSFCQKMLLEQGIRLCGAEVRDQMPMPSYAELCADVERHLASIRQFGAKTVRSLYSYGWLLDIARGLYTLRTGQIVAKTAAGIWALENALCPDPMALQAALRVRQDPLCAKYDPQVMDYAETLGTPIQRFADVLAAELAKCQR